MRIGFLLIVALWMLLFGSGVFSTTSQDPSRQSQPDCGTLLLQNALSYFDSTAGTPESDKRILEAWFYRMNRFDRTVTESERAILLLNLRNAIEQSSDKLKNPEMKATLFRAVLTWSANVA